MGESRALVASGLQGFLTPHNRFIQFTLLDQIGPDVIIGVPEVWVLRDGLVTLLDRMIEPPHEAVGPSEEGVGLGGGMSLNRFFVERHGFFQLTLHLAFVGLLKELPSLALVFFAAFALNEKILNVHSPSLCSSLCRSNEDGLDCACPTRAF